MMTNIVNLKYHKTIILWQVRYILKQDCQLDLAEKLHASEFGAQKKILTKSLQ